MGLSSTADAWCPARRPMPARNSATAAISSMRGGAPEGWRAWAHRTSAQGGERLLLVYVIANASAPEQKFIALERVSKRRDRAGLVYGRLPQIAGEIAAEPDGSPSTICGDRHRSRRDDRSVANRRWAK